MFTDKAYCQRALLPMSMIVVNFTVLVVIPTSAPPPGHTRISGSCDHYIATPDLKRTKTISVVISAETNIKFSLNGKVSKYSNSLDMPFYY